MTSEIMFHQLTMTLNSIFDIGDFDIGDNNIDDDDDGGTFFS